MDEFYANNSQLLPPPVQLGHHDPPPHVQANFTANFVEVAQSKPVKQKELVSANSLHLATIMEVTNEDRLVAINDLDKEYEPGHIDQLVEVLQARAKDIRDSKKKMGSSPPHPGQV